MAELLSLDKGKRKVGFLKYLYVLNHVKRNKKERQCRFAGGQRRARWWEGELKRTKSRTEKEKE